MREKEGTVAALERKLDDFDPEARKEALQELLTLVERGEVFLPPAGEETNVHAHTFFSFNAYGYSPTGFTWRAKRRGLSVAGVVDFDVLHGIPECIACGEALNLRTTGGVETRVFVPEYQDKEINSPKEPGVAYFMGTAFPGPPSGDSAAGKLLERMHDLAQKRTKGIMERVNGFLGEVTLDYASDVIPLTPKGNPTERHLVVAYDKKSRQILGDRAPGFWGGVLGYSDHAARELMNDPPRFQGVIRSKLMKYGSPGYAPPQAGSFPALREVISMIKESGGLPTAPWLDGTSDGEKDAGKLLDFYIGEGTVCGNFIPERNWNIPDPGVKKVKVAKLNEYMEACRARELPVTAGTEMNKYGQPFVDNFKAPELSPYAQDYLEGAAFLYGHTVAARSGPWSYFSDWAESHFGPVTSTDGRRKRNRFYMKIGNSGPFRRSQMARLRELQDDLSPERITEEAARLKPVT